MGPPASPAPFAGAVPASTGGRGGRRDRGSRGRAPAVLGPTCNGLYSNWQLAALGISVQERTSTGQPARPMPIRAVVGAVASPPLDSPHAPTIAVGGRLQRFAAEWEKVTSVVGSLGSPSRFSYYLYLSPNLRGDAG